MPHLDIVRVQDVGLRTSSDPKLLEFAAVDHRILLTHDVRTMETHARARLSAGQTMLGVFIIPQKIPIADAIEAIILIAECSQPEEWNGVIQYLPM